MGVLASHNLAQLQPLHRLVNFVETGTWRGDGLLHALQFPFTKLWSIEACPILAEAAVKCVARQEAGGQCGDRWEILIGDSALIVPELFQYLEEPTLWWLDAHLPERYGVDATRLPLEWEVSAIVSNEAYAQDVFILDDWRLYEHHSYASGCFTAPGGRCCQPGDGNSIRQLLAPTHTLTIDLRAEGALIAVPRA